MPFIVIGTTLVAQALDGNATLGNVRLQDRLSSDDFLRWRSLALNRIQANYDGTTPRVRVGAVALSTFYARIIINPNGRLNLQDIRVQPTEERRSLTQSEPASASGAAASAPAAAPVVASAPTGAPASAVTVTATANGIALVDDAIVAFRAADVAASLSAKWKLVVSPSTFRRWMAIPVVSLERWPIEAS